MDIYLCPSCGSRRLQKVRQDCKREYRGKQYIVPRLEFYECPECGEKLYDREAMRLIEAHSPAYKKRRKRIAL